MLKLSFLEATDGKPHDVLDFENENGTLVHTVSNSHHVMASVCLGL